MLGCCRRAADRASVRNRSSYSAAACVPRPSTMMVLMATWRARLGSRASKTTHMDPSARARTRSYLRSFFSCTSRVLKCPSDEDRDPYPRCCFGLALATERDEAIADQVARGPGQEQGCVAATHVVPSP